MEGKIINQLISIFIDLREILYYITPKIVEVCALKKIKHKKFWLAQLVIGTKRRVSELVECYLVEMKL